MTHKKRGEGITDDDVQKALANIGYTLKPYDIILVRTDTSKHFKEPGNDKMHAGQRRSATEWLIDKGVINQTLLATSHLSLMTQYSIYVIQLERALLTLIIEEIFLNGRDCL